MIIIVLQLPEDGEVALGPSGGSEAADASYGDSLSLPTNIYIYIYTHARGPTDASYSDYPTYCPNP